jgi:trehalose 6-phosphate synthase/phosphatase
VVRPASNSLIVEDEEGSYVSKTYVTEPRRYSSRSPASPSPFPDTFLPPGFSEEDHVLIVSYLPPVYILSEGPEWQLAREPTPWIHSLYQSALDAGVNFQWICILSCSEEVQKVLSEQHHITAVSCSKDLQQRHDLYCEEVLEPIMQGHIQLSPEDLGQFRSELWEGYRAVNSLLAGAVMNERKGEDLIWLHDYQLLMTPSFLGRHQTDPPLNIGLSLHSPFPPSDIFKVLPNHEALLNSMLACDLVSFQCFGYLRSFLSACKRILGAEHCYKSNGLAGVSYFGREIMVKACYCGVIFSEIEEAANSEDCLRLENELREEFKGQKVILSIESAAKVSWLYNNLTAFRDYLSYTPSSALTLLCLCVNEAKPLSRAREQLYVRIQELAADINAKSSRIAVVIREIPKERYSLQLRLAYLKAVHLYWDCTLKGFSPIVVEFALVHRPSWQPIVLSPFSLLSTAFKSAYQVNPFNFQEILDAFHYADWVNADKSLFDERELELLAENEAIKWGEEFLNSLKRAQKNSAEFVFRPLGLGDKLKQVALRRNFDALLPDKLSFDYKRSRNRLILLSNEGALLPLTPAASVQHTSHVLQALEELCKDERNSIYVLSDCEKEGIDAIYSGVGNLGLVAEEGGFIKDKYTGLTWQRMAREEKTWKMIAKEVIELYVERIEGAAMIVRKTMILFCYKHVNQDLGCLLAKEVLTHLELVLQCYQDDCEIVSGADFIKVKSYGCDKGSILQKIALMVTEKKGPIGLVLCIGDGPSDEDMFRATHGDLQVQVDAKRLSCTVGMKPSLASHYVHSLQEVWRLVSWLKDQSVKVRNRQTRGSYSQNHCSDILQGRTIGDRNHPILALSISCVQVTTKHKDDIFAYDEV